MVEDVSPLLFAIEERPDKNAVKAALTGKLNNRRDMKALNSFVEEYQQKGVTAFILDFTEVTFVCSSVFSILAKHLLNFEEKGIALIIYGSTPSILHTIQLMNFHHKIPLFPTYEKALNSIKK